MFVKIALVALFCFEQGFVNCLLFNLMYIKFLMRCKKDLMIYECVDSHSHANFSFFTGIIKNS